MLRNLSAARSILIRYSKSYNVSPRSPVFYQSSRFKYKSPKERPTCPPPIPPPPPQPADDTFLWAMIALAVCTGAFAFFAKDNKELRDWMSIHLPWFDDFIAFLHEENQTHGEFIKSRFNLLKEAISLYFKEEETCVLDSQGNKIVMQGPITEKESECPPEPPPVITKNICEIELCLRDLAETAINNYFTATQICKYNNLMVTECMKDFRLSKLKGLYAVKEEREKLVKTSLDNGAEAVKAFEELVEFMDCGVQATKEEIENTKEMLADLQTAIRIAFTEYQWEQDLSENYDKQFVMVEPIIDQYAGEMKTVYSTINYDAEKPFFVGDPDILLIHTLKYVQHLTNRVMEVQEAMAMRSSRAVDTAMPPQDEAAAKKNQAAVDAAVKKGVGELDANIKKSLDELKKSLDERLKDELKRALDESQETQRREEEKKEEEVMASLSTLVEVKVAEEKALLKDQMDDMSQKLKVVEDTLNAHLKADADARKSVELWIAASALLTATKSGDKMIKVNKELDAIEQAAGDGDALVTSVLKAIPKSVKEEGLLPATVLRKKYHTMESTALKVALVEQDGASLPIYGLSWLQWFLLCLRLSDIPSKEIEHPPTVVGTTLDTFDLMLRSRYWIDRGNVALALRYVNSLEGASWAAANTWRQNAKAYLETKLAAEAVIAHAAALALKYL